MTDRSIQIPDDTPEGTIVARGVRTDRPDTFVIVSVDATHDAATDEARVLYGPFTADHAQHVADTIQAFSGALVATTHRPMRALTDLHPDRIAEDAIEILGVGE